MNEMELSTGQPIGIPAAEYAARQTQLREECRQRGAAAACVFDPDYVKYYCGFYFSVTERPMAFLLSALRKSLTATSSFISI